MACDNGSAMTPRLFRLAIWCAEQELRGRRDGSRPGGVQPWNAELLRALQFQLDVSQAGRECDCGEPELVSDKWLSARETAVVLGLSKRQVNRLAGDLDAEWWDGRRRFRESTVLDYGRRRGGRIAG
jgi:hypothetical protein